MEENYKGFTIKVMQDSGAESPRWDGCYSTQMICFHNSYPLGDKHKFESPKEVERHIKKTKAIALPLYLYDHSGITMNTTGFNCRWDSRQVGMIYIEREKILKEFKVKRLTKNLIKEIKARLIAEVETYDCYLRGEVYGYTIEQNGNELDSCWGYYGHAEYCLEQAKEQADALVPQSIKFIKSIKGGNEQLFKQL